MKFPDVVFAKVNIERGKVCMRRELTTNEVHCHSRTYDFPNDVILIFQILGLYFDMSWEDSFARSHCMSLFIIDWHINFFPLLSSGGNVAFPFFCTVFAFTGGQLSIYRDYEWMRRKWRFVRIPWSLRKRCDRMQFSKKWSMNGNKYSNWETETLCWK